MAETEGKGFFAKKGPAGELAQDILTNAPQIDGGVLLADGNSATIGIASHIADHEHNTLNVNKMDVTELKADIGSIIFTLDMNRVEQAIDRMSDDNLKRFLDNLDEIKLLAEQKLLRRV